MVMKCTSAHPKDLVCSETENLVDLELCSPAKVFLLYAPKQFYSAWGESKPEREAILFWVTPDGGIINH